MAQTNVFSWQSFSLLLGAREETTRRRVSSVWRGVLSAKKKRGAAFLYHFKDSPETLRL